MFDSPNERTTLIAKNSTKDLEESDFEETDTDDQHSNTSSNSNANGDAHSDSEVEDSTEEVHTFRWSRLKFYLIEPMVLILLFAYNLSSTILKNQIIYQTCTAVFLYNDTDCKLLSTKNASEHTKQIETIVQPYAARVFMTTTIIECIVPALCGSFIGSWSDRFGRKPLLVTAFTGYTLYYAVIAIVCYISTMSLLSPWYYLLAVLPHSILGGSVTYNVAAICFISDVSTAEERPYRMTIYEAAIYIGLMLGSFTAGFLYEATNATIVFTVSASSIAFATVILLIFLPESLNLRQAQPIVE
ncbi:proton-coupled folate transporter-like, partial [Teleopsis dalmanni]|uniref:proton-coupled folate transporter-like n=1 Tax=Teleopsis dalmanni TaxID=139649 RepID=UPI0018CD7E23